MLEIAAIAGIVCLGVLFTVASLNGHNEGD